MQDLSGYGGFEKLQKEFEEIKKTKQNEIDLDSSIASSTTTGTKTHEKQLVSEIANSAEDI